MKMNEMKIVATLYSDSIRVLNLKFIMWEAQMEKYNLLILLV